MILPVGASSFKEAMKMGVEVYHNLKVIILSVLIESRCRLWVSVNQSRSRVNSSVGCPWGLISAIGKKPSIKGLAKLVMDAVLGIRYLQIDLTTQN